MSLKMEISTLVWLTILVVISWVSNFSALTAKSGLDVIWKWVSVICDFICFSILMISIFK